jgi:hypothetical protein
MSSIPYVHCFTLAASASQHYSSGTHLAAWAGNPRAVSPCGTHHPVRRQWPVAPQGALAHAQYGTNVQKTQEDACYARSNSPRN